MKILVVDDEEPILRIVREVLESRGHTVLTAPDGRRALETMATESVDLLISDVTMPVMRGPDLAATVRRLHPGMPVVLMSGSERPAGYPFIAKPFRPHNILAALDFVGHCPGGLEAGGI
jgi:CheY-like chemotaxis protein